VLANGDVFTFALNPKKSERKDLPGVGGSNPRTTKLCLREGHFSFLQKRMVHNAKLYVGGEGSREGMGSGAEERIDSTPVTQ